MIKLNEIFTFENLMYAHQRCRKCKQHKREVIEFEMNLSENIFKIQKQIFEKKYSIPYYRKFKVFEPKERIIESLNYTHRIVQNCLCFHAVKPVFEKRLIYDNGACRENKGTDFARNRLKKFLRNYMLKFGNSGYVLKCDIKKYFQNINHKILKALLKPLFSSDVFWLLCVYIDSQNVENGIPIGNQSSQWFALFYLNVIDRFIKEKLKCKYYVRYMDDFLIIDNSKEKLREYKKLLKIQIEQLGLILNKKTKIIKINEGICFLGYKFFTQKNFCVMKVLKNSQKRMKKGILKSIIKYNSNVLNTKNFISELFCYQSFLKTPKFISFLNNYVK